MNNLGCIICIKMLEAILHLVEPTDFSVCVWYMCLYNNMTCLVWIRVKNHQAPDSLVVHWWWICLSMQGTIPHAAEQLSPCTTTIESVLWSPELQPLSPCSTREASAQQLQSSPCLMHLEKSPCGNKDAIQSEIKEWINENVLNQQAHYYVFM